MAKERIGQAPEREVTDPKVYASRRAFLRGAIALGTVGASALAYRGLFSPDAEEVPGTLLAVAAPVVAAARPPGEALTSYRDITSYNNFYEFSTDKHEPARVARGFVSSPWTVSVEGLVSRPRTFDVEQLMRESALQERVYRLRCVEGWSMVIPWIGFPLRDLIRAADPLGTARFVQFETLHDPARFPNQKRDVLEWPYVEGLRLDEAMHPLTLLAVGLYGKTLPAQNGAPLRLVVPWKYGFKSIKSIVKLRFTRNEPRTTWKGFAPGEYGFYANVNPGVPHPRWSQARERRIGEFGKRDTLLFNGYASEVGGLYGSLDLQRSF